jgi:hypothetical protein
MPSFVPTIPTVTVFSPVLHYAESAFWFKRRPASQVTPTDSTVGQPEESCPKEIGGSGFRICFSWLLQAFIEKLIVHLL